MKLHDCTYFLANRLTRSLKRAFDLRLEVHGLTAATWCAMMALAEKGPLTQKELSEILALENPTVTRTVDRLVEKGFIERRLVPHDRRYSVVSMTGKGAAILGQIEEVGSCFMGWVTRDLDDEEVRVLKQLLIRIHDHVVAG
ncbi:MAG: MarR family transcriptional regulator [Deltaproteobacteria bacterium]|nr:MarR family transcriptional regulator [Candidatus Anaeroferrophillus wilburensis]MBN2888563.1 MarR family transcriptional regulator [Deltaproteobacteria bacterium]